MNLINLMDTPYHHIVLLVVFSVGWGCGTESNIITNPTPSIQYPGAPTITVKLKSRSPEKVEYYLESDIILPYDITVRATFQGICTTDNKTYNFGGKLFFEEDCDDVGYEAKMKAGTVIRHFAACNRSALPFPVPKEWLVTNVEDDCLVKTLTLIIAPWSGTNPGAYNVGTPSRLTIFKF